MRDKTNQQYLLHEQYKDASNLNARIQLHRRFSTNQVNWYHWVFDQYDIAPGSRILELGCGPALLWRENLNRVPDSWDMTLTDFSPGMLQEAQNNLHGSDKHFTFGIVDAQSIPFETNSFDVVIANHMLYHVPDRAKALQEVRRVLRPAGRFYAVTNGEDHLLEILQLRQRAGLDLPSRVASSPFTLENGGEQLAPWFADREQQLFHNSLVITETEPLVAFVLSTIKQEEGIGKVEGLRQLIDQELAQHGTINVQLVSGMFIAYGEPSETASGA